ncbi:MAG: proton-conducting transporter membrane subunit [Actinomycetota bacterium]|nr:proton-conducting transporter membrane subunit [Actinomycetota bacterium]
MLRIAGELGLAATVALPLLNAAIAVATRSRRGLRGSSALAWMATAGALLALITVAVDGGFRVGLGGTTSPAQLLADHLTSTLALFISGVGALVRSFSSRYLSQDDRAWRFAAGADLVVASMVVVATAANISLIAIAWMAAGVSFAAVLGYRRDLPGASRAAKTALVHFVAVDAALLIGVTLVVSKLGNLPLGGGGGLARAASHLGVMAIPVAALATLAALTRSAQGPVGRWLPATIAAPTPASALLHAGVVNGGGILLVRLAGLAQGSAWVVGAALAIAIATAAVATRLMRHRADVKGELAYSTVAQMAFMTAEASVGAYLATLVHLMGHGAFKATLFLSSGSRVRRGQHQIAHEAQGGLIERVAMAAAAGAATLVALMALGSTTDNRAGYVLAAFAAATAASAAWTFTRHRPEPRTARAVAMVAMVAAAFAYGGALSILGGWLTPSLPVPAHGALAPVWLLAIAGLSAMAGLAGRRGRLESSLTAWSIDAATATVTRERAPGFLLSLRSGASDPDLELEEGDAA